MANNALDAWKKRWNTNEDKQVGGQNKPAGSVANTSSALDDWKSRWAVTNPPTSNSAPVVNDREMEESKEEERSQTSGYEEVKPTSPAGTKNTNRRAQTVAERAEGKPASTNPRAKGNNAGDTSSRLGKGVQSIGLNTAASVEYLVESGKQAVKNQDAYEQSGLREQLAEAYTNMNLAGREFGPDSQEYLETRAQFDAIQREIDDFMSAPDKAVDMNSRAAQFMGGVQQLQEEALEGTSGVGRFVGETALSVGSNLAKLPLNAIVPGSSLALMGAEAAAGKAYELGQRGVSAGNALTRGLVSGGIEALTEKIGLDNLMGLIKTGGKSALMNIAKQALAEGGEEGLSYILNYMADSVVGDPEAEFVLNDFFKSIGMGALSGGVFGAGGTALYALGSQDADVDPVMDRAMQLLQEQMGNSNTENVLPNNTFNTENVLPNTENVLEEQNAPASGAQSAQEPISPMVEETVTRPSNPVLSLLEKGSASAETLAAKSKGDETFWNQVDDLVNTGKASFDDGGNLFLVKAEEHIDRRGADDVGSQKVKAFQYLHPQLHEHFAQAAKGLLTDLEGSTKASRYQTVETGVGMDMKWIGEKRNTVEPIARLLDNYGFTYDEVRKGLEDIIANHGSENYAKAKRLELVLDDILTDGYTDIDGMQVEPNQDYIQAKSAIAGAKVGASRDAETIANDVFRVNRAATALGENGSRALSAVYGSHQISSRYAPDEIVHGFYEVYNEAMTGKAMSEEGKRRAAALPENVRYMAESSGKEDARRAAHAKHFGKDAKLVRDANWKKANLSSKASRKLDALAKVLGVQIKFVEQVDGGQSNGSYQDGVISVALDTESPVMTVVIHEAVHRLREASPGSYAQLAEFVRQNMSEQQWLANFVVDQNDYGADKSLDYLNEEIVADAFGTILNDSGLLEQFAKEHTNILQRLADNIRDIVRKVKGASTLEELKLTQTEKDAFSSLADELQGMEKAMRNALKTAEAQKSAGKETKNATQKGGVKMAAKRAQPDYNAFRTLYTKSGLDDLSVKLGDLFPLSANFETVIRKDKTPLSNVTITARSAVRNNGESFFSAARRIAGANYPKGTQIKIDQIDVDTRIDLDFANESISKAKNKTEMQTILDIIPHVDDLLPGSRLLAVEKVQHLDNKKTSLFCYRLYNAYDRIETDASGKTVTRQHAVVFTVVQNLMDAGVHLVTDIKSIAPDRGRIAVNSKSPHTQGDASVKTIAELYEIVKRISREAGGLLYAPGQELKYKFSYTERADGTKYSRKANREYAPVFYSQMGKVIEGVKQDKLGAASVVPMLKGKGVKAEEIKWSGIETFLEGKKSVTKQELQEFIQSNQFEIEEQERTDVIRYSEEQRAELDRLEAENDKLFDQMSDNWYALFGEYIPIDLLGSRNMYDRASRKLDARGKGATPEARAIREAIHAYEMNEVFAEGIRDDAKEQHNNARWKDYTLDGGENYREYLFKMPGSEYTNQAMKAHWGSDNTGVLAHARVQDFTHNDEPVLFIEEIQSDWHNAGQKFGYGKAGAENRTAVIAGLRLQMEEIQKQLDNVPFPSDDLQGEEWYKAYEASMEESRRLGEEYTRVRNRLWEAEHQTGEAVPDAPYSKNYHEFVLKNLLRKAAEGGYSYLAWTPGWLQEERWSSEYAEGYRIEYDQDIPKFLNKYGKQWGAHTEDISLDDLQNVTVHALPITDAMRESVLYEGQPRFKMKRAREEGKNLLAIHNKNADSILEALKLGGFPMPSIAIVKDDMGHDKFGDVSVLFRKETISPTNRQNKVYGADAWTPTRPAIGYKVNEKVLDKMEKRIEGLLGGRDLMRAYRLMLDDENAKDALTRWDGDFKRAYGQNEAMRIAFLKDTGVAFKPVMKEHAYTHHVDNIVLRRASHALGKGKARELMNAGYEDVMKQEPLIRKLMNDRMEEQGAPRLYDKPIGYSTLDNILRAAASYEKGGDTKEVDTSATKTKVEKLFTKKRQAEYEKWLEGLAAGIIEKRGIRNDKDPFTPSGNRRSFEQLYMDYNLENIVKAMKGDSEKGAGIWGTGNIFGAATKDYSSIAEIKADSDRLVAQDEETHKAEHDAFSNRLAEITSRMLKPGDSGFGATLDAGDAAVEALLKGKTVKGILRELKSWRRFNATEQIAQDIYDLAQEIANAPTTYFEAKPRRAVGFDEVAAVVMPRNGSVELKAQLESRGIQVLTYNPNKEGDRLKKINSVDGIKFSKNRRQALDDYIAKYGAIPKGEKPARDVLLPVQTADGKYVSQTARTVLEAGATPDELVPTVEKLVARGDFSFDRYTDEQAISDAENRIRKVGWAQSLAEWMDTMKSGNVSKQNTAMGWALYNNAANSNDTETALTVLNQMVSHQRSAAQALQATRILKKLSPETQLYQAQRSIESLQEELNERYGEKGAPELVIDKDLAEAFIKAKEQEERDAILRDIYRDIGRQMPSRFTDKWNAWRYLAMLGNPRTHVRNVVGNLGFVPVVATKNLTATAIESVVSRVSGGKLNRTKSVVTGASKRDRALLSAAWADYDKVQEAALSGGKYSDLGNANQYIEEGRQIFRFKPLDAARKGNSKALDMEDVWFSKPHYAFALASYCKAHNISESEIAKGGKALNKARAYAVLEAQKATYRDTNALSQTISGFGRGTKAGKNPVKKGVSLILEGILPFRKTPANILARGIEYSPIGLMNGIKQAVFDVKKGTKTGAEAIDSISAGLTGTGLLALGCYLAAQGLIRGHGSGDDDENEFEELMGHQAYALELPGGTSVTLDWLAPEALPFFVGVNLYEQTGGEAENVNMATILGAVSTVSEPMLEMSCLQSLNDLFDSVGYAASEGLSGLPSALSSAVTSYLTQALPTILGQAERTGEDKRYSTYTEKNAFLTGDMQYTIGKASARIPGWDFQQIPYIDAWGRTEATGDTGARAFNNFANPSYVSEIDTSDMEEELLQLYKQTGEAGVLPSRAAKYFQVDGERKNLTAEEYVEYATRKGQTSYELLTELMDSRQYRSMSDEEKVKAIKEAYDYANQMAKAAISDYETESWVQKAAEAERKYGISQEQYIALKTRTAGITSLKDANGKTIENSKGLQIMQMVYQTPGLTEKQRQAMFEYLGVGKTIRHYNKALVEQKLAEMRKK